MPPAYISRNHGTILERVVNAIHGIVHAVANIESTTTTYGGLGVMPLLKESGSSGVGKKALQVVGFNDDALDIIAVNVNGNAHVLGSSFGNLGH